MNKRPIPYLSNGEILLKEVLLPIGLCLALGYILDQLFWEKFRTWLVSIPTYGPRFQATRVYRLLSGYHAVLFTLPQLIMVTVSSWQSQVAGPGRTLLRFLGEGTWELFPPPFSYTSKSVQDLIFKTKAKDPTARVVGYYKRFPCDQVQERRNGLYPGGPGDYWPILLTETTRFRHIQVVGSTGSGKSASLIAPLLFQDAAAPNLATFTINPKSDLYLIKCMITGVLRTSENTSRNSVPPTALISMVRKESLAYDPLIYGTADTITKKIIGSMEFESTYYKGVQETWLMSFFRVVKTEPALTNRVMLRHLHAFLVTPLLLQTQIKPLVTTRENQDRIDTLSVEDKKNLSGVASHIAALVEDESLAHIFDNPTGHYLDIRDVIRQGGNIYLEVDTNAKGPQSRALGRMLIMELQLFASARQAGAEPLSPSLMCFVDEFASFGYTDFVDLLDKCRSARMGFLLAHQCVGNLKRGYLSPSFQSEVVDNTRTKFLLDIKAETAAWASELLGEQRMTQVTESLGVSKDSRYSRNSKTTSSREEFAARAVADMFNLAPGPGFAQIESKEGRIMSCPITVGYIDDAMLCTDAELIRFLADEQPRHPKRPLNGSLIDNDIPYAEAPGVKLEEGEGEGGGSAATLPAEASPEGAKRTRRKKVKQAVHEGVEPPDELDMLLKTEL